MQYREMGLDVRDHDRFTLQDLAGAPIRENLSQYSHGADSVRGSVAVRAPIRVGGERMQF